MIPRTRRFTFTSKALTLERLRPLLRHGSIPALEFLTVGQWRTQRDTVCDKLQKAFGDATVIVRSSSLSEDSEVSARAGAFLSIPHVDVRDLPALTKAICAVVASYGDEPNGDDNQVIVQKMITEVAMSGVLFTHDMNTGAPYYVINYDDESGDTDQVTSGSYLNRTLYVLRKAVNQLSSVRFRSLLEAVEEVESIVAPTALDIEFAVDKKGCVHIFQVRPIATRPSWRGGLGIRVEDAVERVQSGLADRYGTHDGVLGTVLGSMPDWNPAEMIGTQPRPLAFSLYRTLITDRAWREARRQMGYFEPRGMPLMLSLAGHPYIDVRQSFRSFLPSALPEEIGKKIVDAWLEYLRAHPQFHDKVEFSVATTIYTPGCMERFDERGAGALSGSERSLYERLLRELTIGLIGGRRGSIAAQHASIRLLDAQRRETIEKCDRANFETFAVLLEDVVDLGTIPFSILARHGFIAKNLLDSFVALGALSTEAVGRLLQSIPTIASEFLVDLRRSAEGQMSAEDFTERYGHLRPGTYDILSVRYDSRGELSARNLPQAPAAIDPKAVLSTVEQKAITDLLAQSGLPFDAATILDYIRQAIQGREFAKFVFTHNISDALEVIAEWGEHYGLSREEVSYIDIRTIFDATIEPRGRSMEQFLREQARRGAEHHEVATAIRLPHLIRSLSDVSIVPLAVELPNYITRKNTAGAVYFLHGNEVDGGVIDGHIVAIRAADPGYDWIFSRPIRGLITQFGGANSHMAIRCAEFGLPAAIGCGEQIFSRVIAARSVVLNCEQAQIIIG